MGPKHKAKSTRAARRRSVNSSSKPRRKPAAPKPSKLRTGADVLRDLRERRADATLRVARAAEPAGAPEAPYISPTQLVREMRDGVPATELCEIGSDLNLILACVIVVRHALKEQNVELDQDAATILKRYIGDELDSQIERISHLIGDPDRKE